VPCRSWSDPPGDGDGGCGGRGWTTSRPSAPGLPTAAKTLDRGADDRVDRAQPADERGVRRLARHQQSVGVCESMVRLWPDAQTPGTRAGPAGLPLSPCRLNPQRKPLCTAFSGPGSGGCPDGCRGNCSPATRSGLGASCGPWGGGVGAGAIRAHGPAEGRLPGLSPPVRSLAPASRAGRARWSCHPR